jgi:hypothetical protein
VLYRFYTDPATSLDIDIVGPDGALALLLKEKRPSGEQPGDGLWDAAAHNLLITARAIEGLIDVADYYTRFRNQRLDTPAEKPLDLATTLAEAVYPRIAEMIAASPIRSPSSEPASSLAIPTLSLNKEDFQAELLATIEDAISGMPAASVGGINREQLLVKAIGVDKVQKLQANNKGAAALLEGLVWLTFCSAARVFDVILHDAVLHQLISFDPKRGDSAVRKFIKTDTETVDRRTLLERLSLALKEFADAEIRSAEKNQSAPPDYVDVIRRGLERPATAPKAK